MTKSSTQMKMSKIAASLSHGNFIAGKKMALLCFALIISLLSPLITIIMLIIPGVEWDRQIIITLSICNIMFISFFTVLVFIMVKNNKLKKKIIIWLEDAIEVRAYSRKTGENRLGIQPKATKIQVSFKVADTNIIRDSTGKVFGGCEGYLGTYTKYADRKINILYSQKHDQILILKD